MLVRVLLPRFILAEADYGQLFVWSMVLIGFLVVAFGGITLLKRWLRKENTPSGVGFTLVDLRQLHRQGKLTDAEFEKAKQQLLGKLAQAKPPDSHNPHSI